MTILQGSMLSPGFADGRAIVYDERESQPQARLIEDVQGEIVRLQRALKAATQDLQQLCARVHSEFGASEAEIFSTHLEILRDPTIIDDIVSRIKSEKINAEQAIHLSIAGFAGRLQHADDPYLREREQDIRDIGQRLIRHACGRSSRRLSELPEASIIVAGELMPSDLAELDYSRLVGVVTERGGATSHLAILTRSLGIPAITGIANAMALIEDGQRLLIEGDRNRLVVAPTYTLLEQYREHREQFSELSKIAARGEHLPCRTLDGRDIQILANMARPNETELAASGQSAGVGLLRTEFLFLDHPEPPSVQQQVEVYEKVAQRLGGRELVIRTLDLGGDKHPLFLERDREANPSLGLRGIRFSLAASLQLFRDQITALLRVARRHPLSIMLPMVVDVEDLAAARGIIQDLARAEGLDAPPPIGALIETPSAVLMVDDILQLADFVSIGTNDLTQFILATDRNASGTAREHSAMHPAVLRAVRQVVEASERRSRPLTVCGEAASVPELAALFVGLGVRRLSMSPASSAIVKHAIRNARFESLKAAAELAAGAGSLEEASKIVAALTPARA